MRKTTGLVILLFLGLTVSSCGSNVSSQTPGNINGTWMAILTNPDGSIAYQFSATFTQSTAPNSASPISPIPQASHARPWQSRKPRKGHLM